MAYDDPPRDFGPPPEPPPPAEPPPVDIIGAVESGQGGQGSVPPPEPPPSDPSQDTTPASDIGDIPPPPTPAAPEVGLAGAQGLGGSTFTMPGTQATQGFRSPDFLTNRITRFGPGTPLVGMDEGLGINRPLTDDDLANVLAVIAGRQQKR